MKGVLLKTVMESGGIFFKWQKQTKNYYGNFD